MAVVLVVIAIVGFVLVTEVLFWEQLRNLRDVLNVMRGSGLRGAWFL
jgi:hypothetical protein